MTTDARQKHLQTTFESMEDAPADLQEQWAKGLRLALQASCRYRALAESSWAQCLLFEDFVAQQKRHDTTNDEGYQRCNK